VSSHPATAGLLPRWRRIQIAQPITATLMTVPTTAPVASVADASAVTSAADVVIMVVDLETARRDMLVEAREQILRSGTPLMGIVINRDRDAQGQYMEYDYVHESGANGAADKREQRRGQRQAERRQSV